jgi:two-component sensor histidine kinase
VENLFDYASFAPHGFCLLWNPWLIALHVVADLLIFTSYFAIPGALFLFLRRRPGVRYGGLVALFAAFILLCGLTHLFSLATLWIPVYTAEGVLKLLTGLVSAATAIVLFRLVPRLVAIPTPGELEAANARLRDEIAAHETTLAQLREAQRDLETKVAERTAALTSATKKLSVLSRESVHRSRNLLTVVSSIARQTARATRDIDRFLDSFLGRIDALGTATATLNERSAATSLRMADLIERQLHPVVLTFGERLEIGGPSVDLNPQAAQQISLILHELATNSQKHGALARPEGRVRIAWSLDGRADDRVFRLNWDEPDGPRGDGSIGGGFGSALLLRIAPVTLGGRAEASFEHGFGYRLAVPLDRVVPTVGADDQAEELAQRIVDAAWG